MLHFCYNKNQNICGEREKMYRKILLGIDNSDNAIKAVEKVIELKKRDNSEVVVFHSVLHQIPEITPGFTMNVNSSQLVSLQLHQHRVEESKNLLERIKSKFEELELTIETRLIDKKKPQYYIKEQVEKEGFDLVVLGCKGEHSKLKRTFLGTVPEYVVNNAKCDVLIIK